MSWFDSYEVVRYRDDLECGDPIVGHYWEVTLSFVTFSTDRNIRPEHSVWIHENCHGEVRADHCVFVIDLCRAVISILFFDDLQDVTMFRLMFSEDIEKIIEYIS